MAAFHEEAEVGLEEGMLWLPSHVLDEACDVKAYMKHQQHIQHHHHPHQHHQCQQNSNFKTRTEPQAQQYSKYGPRPKLGNGGSGMLAIFLESGQRSCGTGVFLPQGAGRKFQTRKKPVLLPARVVQALNLDVQALGLQISPRQDPRYNPTYSTNKKNDKKDAYCGVISGNQSSSPEIFLPKDWSY